VELTPVANRLQHAAADHRRQTRTWTRTTPSRAAADRQGKEELTLCGKPNGFNTVLATRNSGKEPRRRMRCSRRWPRFGIVARQPHDASLYFRSTIGAPSNVHAKGYG